MTNSKVLEQLLKSEIKEVVGCTEPASVAFAFARAADLLGKDGLKDDFKAAVVVSRDVFRNISTVKVPVMKIKGIFPAAACGIYTKSRGFNPFLGIGPAEKNKIASLLKRRAWLKVSVKNVDGIFVDARIEHKGKKSRVVVEGYHDNGFRESGNFYRCAFLQPL